MISSTSIVENDNISTDHTSTKLPLKNPKKTTKKATKKIDKEIPLSTFDDEKSTDKIKNGKRLALPFPDNVAVGITSDGEKFAVPETYDCVETLYTVKKWKELPVFIELFLFITYITLFAIRVSKWYFLGLFVFWRLMYNVGLGFILYKQSSERSFSNFIKRQLTSYDSTWFRGLFERNVSTKVASTTTAHNYDLSIYPMDFNAWMAFRVIVDIILSSDFLSYLCFVFSFLELPESLESLTLLDYFLYALGILLCVFNFWAKSDAHRVLGDYAWYWGDFFFSLEKNLIFDGIFQMFPHPMYTVGYSFYYGCSLITRSYTVFYVSFLAHMLQLTFLTIVENPHIEKTYGAMTANEDPERDEVLGGYFEKRRELIMLFNFNAYRASDFFLIVIVLKTILLFIYVDSIAVLLVMTVLWRVLHTLLLGWILKRQGEDQFWTKRFEGKKLVAFENWKKLFNLSMTMNHLAVVGCAFRLFQWPTIFIVDSQQSWWLNIFHVANSETLGTFVMLQCCGLMLIGLNIWGSHSSYEVLGDFGWFYGDFFIVEMPNKKLFYTGIYRYLNNPEMVLGFAGYYGLAVMTRSYIMLCLAVFAHVSQMLFTHFVETPYMKVLYGRDQVRERSGIVSAIRQNLEKVPKQFEKMKEKMNELTDELSERVQEFKKDLENIQKTVATEEGRKQLTEEAQRVLKKFTDNVRETSVKTSL